MPGLVAGVIFDFIIMAAAFFFNLGQTYFLPYLLSFLLFRREGRACIKNCQNIYIRTSMEADERKHGNRDSENICF